MQGVGILWNVGRQTDDDIREDFYCWLKRETGSDSAGLISDKGELLLYVVEDLSSYAMKELVPLSFPT